VYIRGGGGAVEGVEDGARRVSVAGGEDEERDGNDEYGQDRLMFSGEHNSSSEESDDQHDPDEIASGFAISLSTG
jgi:hypothetical protein